MLLKKPISFEEQLNRIREHGVKIEDPDKAMDFLKTCGYYRFTGYAMQFRKSPSDSDYVDGTSFENIRRIYEFDEAMRNTLRKYIEIAEIFYRTKISYGFSMVKCKEPPHDQHYYENNYYDKDVFNKVKTRFSKEEQYYKDSLIVKHHKRKYGGKMPLWVITELLSFSNLSQLYSCMYDSEKQAIAAPLGLSAKRLQNNLHCMSVLRNKCAHGARLYNDKLKPPAMFAPAMKKAYGDMALDSLFAYILILLNRLPHLKDKENMIIEIDNIVKEYEEDIDFSLIGFPQNYEDILRKEKSAT